MNTLLYKQMCDIVSSEQIKRNEPMKEHTTFRVGGNADYYIIPDEIKQISELVKLCKKSKLDYYILGRGSNLLVSDKGYQGVIIQLLDNLSQIEVKGDYVKAQAGALLYDVAEVAACKNLTGLEFASGIPGTIGGAVVMNAGAYDGEIKNVIDGVSVMTEDGTILELNNEELQFGYRRSAIIENDYIVLDATMRLSKGKEKEIREKMDDLQIRRESKQPLEYPSAGSTFKRPQGYFAGKLIMDAGLCGYKIGDAQVSTKHCGFVINNGNASASEILQLISHIQNEVKWKFGVELVAEVKLLGDFNSQ